MGNGTRRDDNAGVSMSRSLDTRDLATDKLLEAWPKF